MEQDAPPCLIAFRRLTLCPATGTPQRGGPYHPGANMYVGVWVQLNRGTLPCRAGSPLPAAVVNPRVRAYHDGARSNAPSLSHSCQELLERPWTVFNPTAEVGRGIAQRCPRRIRLRRDFSGLPSMRRCESGSGLDPWRFGTSFGRHGSGSLLSDSGG
jgi:hypothetical protein